MIDLVRVRAPHALAGDLRRFARRARDRWPTSILVNAGIPAHEHLPALAGRLGELLGRHGRSCIDSVRSVAIASGALYVPFPADLAQRISRTTNFIPASVAVRSGPGPSHRRSRPPESSFPRGNMQAILTPSTSIGVLCQWTRLHVARSFCKLPLTSDINERSLDRVSAPSAPLRSPRTRCTCHFRPTFMRRISRATDFIPTSVAVRSGARRLRSRSRRQESSFPRGNMKAILAFSTPLKRWFANGRSGASPAASVSCDSGQPATSGHRQCVSS